MKMKLLGLHFLLYSCVGAMACVVDLGTFFVLSYMVNVSSIVSTSLSFTLATLLNYILCFKFIFNPGTIPLKSQLVRVFFVALLGLFCNTLGFWVLSLYTALSAMWIKTLVIPVVLLWNFWGRRKFVYSPEIHPETLVILNKLLKGKLLPFLEGKKS